MEFNNDHLLSNCFVNSNVNEKDLKLFETNHINSIIDCKVEIPRSIGLEVSEDNKYDFDKFSRRLRDISKKNNFLNENERKILKTENYENEISNLVKSNEKHCNKIELKDIQNLTNSIIKMASIKKESNPENYIDKKNLVIEKIINKIEDSSQILKDEIKQLVVDDEDIPEEIEINNPEKTDYNQFLEESLNEKNEIQNLLRDEMKKIISNINHREKDKSDIKRDKIQTLLKNINVKERMFEESVGNETKVFKNDEKSQDLIKINKNNLNNNYTQNNINDHKFSMNCIDSLTDFNKNKQNIELIFNINNPKITFQNTNSNNQDEEDQDEQQNKGDLQNQEEIDFINEFAKNYEEEIKYRLEKEDYPVNEDYLKNNQNEKTIQNSIKESSFADNIKDIVRHENIFSDDTDNCLEEEDKDLFGEENIVYNKSNVKELFNDIKKNKEEEDKDSKLLVFDNFKDTSEL